MENKKESNNIWLIVLLVLIIFGLVGYICYDKFNSKEKKLDYGNIIELELDSKEVEDAWNFVDAFWVNHRINTQIVNAKEHDDTLDIYAKVVFIKDENHETAYGYKSLIDTEPIDVFNVNYSLVPDNWNLYNTYKFTFTRTSDSNWQWISTELVG